MEREGTMTIEANQLGLEFVDDEPKKKRGKERKVFRTIEDVNHELQSMTARIEPEIEHAHAELLPWLRKGPGGRAMPKEEDLTQVQKVLLWLRRWGYISRKETIFAPQNGMVYIQLPRIIWDLRHGKFGPPVEIDSETVYIRPGVKSVVYKLRWYDPMGIYQCRPGKMTRVP
jgi:hypothetical protein